MRMAKHAEGVRSQPESTLILILTPRQTTLLRPPLTRRAAALPILLPTRQRSLGALELRMLLWDGNDAWLLDCVNLGDALERRVRRWPAGGR
jgi:hypothetical protein